jgi:indole-3-glycerol phosphate synthase
VSRLADIVASKRREIEALRSAGSVVAKRRDPIDVAAALRRTGALKLIAEVKLRSPSAGPLSRVLSPEQRAIRYAQAGASMVSVLCDEPFFDGSWEHLQAARTALDGLPVAPAARRAGVPLLAKDFILDERQIEEAALRGADAVLLIARIVPRDHLSRLVRAARDHRLEPLVEVVDEHELASGLEAGARVIGVNARDLDTLAMDAGRAARVVAAIPQGVVAVHFSGLRGPDDVRQVAGTRADAALVGEALMRADDPRPLLEAMVAAAETST